MRVAADARHTANAEVEWLEGTKPCFLDERHDERPKTAIDVQSNIVAVCHIAECDDIIGVAVGEAYRGAYKLYRKTGSVWESLCGSISLP